MITNLKARFWEFVKWFGGLFIILFMARLLYGFLEGEHRYSSESYNEDFFSSINNVKRNYASEKGSVKFDTRTRQAVPDMGGNQKFEKTANVRSKSTAFDLDEKSIKAKTKSYNAVIQYEQNKGQTGYRQMHLLIGVNPEKFDSFYVDMLRFGEVRATDVTKIDKTNEYKQLMATKVSIEKTLQSMNELKSKGGQISDYVTLNEKIQELEERLQALGVDLGNFDEENEFCTVKMSLYEGAEEQPVSVLYRMKKALEWTIEYFAIFVFSLLGMSITILILLFIIEKLKVMRMINDKNN